MVHTTAQFTFLPLHNPLRDLCFKYQQVRNRHQQLFQPMELETHRRMTLESVLEEDLLTQVGTD